MKWKPMIYDMSLAFNAIYIFYNQKAHIDIDILYLKVPFTSEKKFDGMVMV